MTSKDKILLEDLVCAISSGSTINGKYVQEKIARLRPEGADSEIPIAELRRLALSFLDSLFSEDSDKH